MNDESRDTVVVINIGTLLSGDLAQPVLDADHVVIKDGRIAAIGRGAPSIDGAVVHDAAGLTVLPGLIDNHAHPVIGDYTPRQRQSDYLEGFVHGGVTSAVSAGEVHTPGRPRDAAGTKALAVLAHKAFAALRPGGLKMHAGALLLEPGLVEADFAELASHGVHLVGEIGISGIQDVDEAAQMTRWAQAAGMTVTVHVGGASLPTSRTVDGAFVVAVRPDVAAHVNGGPTAAALADVERILDDCDAHVEIVHNGNVRAARDVARLVADRAELHRLVLGTDSPAGSGVQPLGILRTLSWLASLADIPPAVAVATATGNTARARRIDGGLIAVGRPADLLLADAPSGSRAGDFCEALQLGDTPSIAAVLIDGDLVVTRSRNTPPPATKPHLG
jgi:enamidase